MLGHYCENDPSSYKKALFLSQRVEIEIIHFVFWAISNDTCLDLLIKTSFDRTVKVISLLANNLVTIS